MAKVIAGDMFYVIQNWEAVDSIRGPYQATKIDKDFVYTKDKEICFYAAWCFKEQYLPEVKEVAAKREAIKKELDDSMGLVYSLMNKIKLDK